MGRGMWEVGLLIWIFNIVIFFYLSFIIFRVFIGEFSKGELVNRLFDKLNNKKVEKLVIVWEFYWRLIYFNGYLCNVDDDFVFGRGRRKWWWVG